MRSTRWSWEERCRAVIVSARGERVPLAVNDVGPGVLPPIRARLEGSTLQRVTGTRQPTTAFTLRTSLPTPRRDLSCVGRDGRAHAQEPAGTAFHSATGTDAAQGPVVFTTLPQVAVGPFDAVRLPGRTVSEQIDREGEIAVVIGRGGPDIRRLIAACSLGITLMPGELTATGTPADLGTGFSPSRWLGPDDGVRVEIDGPGRIENRLEH